MKSVDVIKNKIHRNMEALENKKIDSLNAFSLATEITILKWVLEE